MLGRHNNSRTNARRRTRHARRGVALLEGAIVLPVALLFIYGGLEIGILTTRYNALSEASRCGARAAIVRGSEASELGTLGPETLEMAASESHPIAEACRNMLPLMNPDEVQITVEWPTGENQTDDRVRVTLEYQNEFLVSLLGDYGTIDISASSIMTIAH